MVTCELDSEISGEVLGWKLQSWQALLFNRVLPTCGGLVVYITLMCFDFALVCEYYKGKENGIASFCVILIIFPALISMIFTLASPPPGLQTEEGRSIRIERKDLKWIAIEIVKSMTFPVAAIVRYCYLIFWWVEAVFAARDEDKDRTKDALSRAHAPSSLELYLFLQAFLHSAPHCIVNVLQIMAKFNNPEYDIVVLQAVSFVVSCMRMASTATLYRRFEREKICGRKYPWARTNEINKTVTKEVLNEEIHAAPEEEPIYETLKRAPDENQQQSRMANSDLIQFSPSNPEKSKLFFEDTYSDTSSNYTPPVRQRPRKNSQTSSGFNSEDEYMRPVSIINKVAPRRRDTTYTIEKVDVPAPPAMQAPRPGTIAIWAEKMVENAESIPGWLSAPQRRRHINEEVPRDEPDIPRRVPRSFIRGIEPQDLTGALVQFLGWYSFFVARLLSIAAFWNFFSFAAIIILFCHYQVMLLLLIVPQAPTVRRAFYIFLAFVYLFCLMEFKIRFRHVRVWHVFWTIVCTIEIIIFSALWANINNNLEPWWIHFVLYVVFVSMILSYMCFLVFFMLLKPKETIVNIKNNIH